MHSLNETYAQRLEDIKAAIQESELLSTYIDSEEPDDYAAFKEAFEPEVAALYEEVAADAPLQLEALERSLLDDGLEGLFLPRVLGYAVLRPRVSDRGQFNRPQEHLREVLLAIANSGAFPELERRIGQGVTTAFALSTSVWVTNLIADIPTKVPRTFYASHQNHGLRTPELRLKAYNRYKRQFSKHNFSTASFPTSLAEAAVSYPDLESFLRYRFGNEMNNESLVAPVQEMLKNKALQGSPNFERFTNLVSMFMEMPDASENKLRTDLRAAAKDNAYAERFFRLLAELHHDAGVHVSPEVDRRMALRVGTSGDTTMSQYYNLTTTIHDHGINHLETQDAVRIFIREQKGTSDVTECVRQTVLRYFTQLLGNLDTDSYTEFFDITKLFAVYFDIFGNESFRQNLREQSVRYIKSLLKVYTDKRGRDYQDIKKFVKTSFEDLGFMTERELVNFFKTKRKRKPSAV